MASGISKRNFKSHGIINEASELFLENVHMKGWIHADRSTVDLSGRASGRLRVVHLRVWRPKTQPVSFLMPCRWHRAVGRNSSVMFVARYVRPFHLGKSSRATWLLMFPRECCTIRTENPRDAAKRRTRVSRALWIMRLVVRRWMPLVMARKE
jgi:hypothetical protein